MALNLQPTALVPRGATADGRSNRRRHLALAMATGLFAIVIGVWHWAPDNDSPLPSQAPVPTAVSSRGTP